MSAKLAATATTLLLRSNLTGAFQVTSAIPCATRSSLRLSTCLTCSTKMAATSMPSLPTVLGESYDAFSPTMSRNDHVSVPIRATIGNEAGDADSIVSSLVHGYALQLEEEMGSKINDQSSKTKYAPLVGVPRADLPLRRETTLLLEMAGVDLDRLLFIDSPSAIATLLTQTDDGASCASNPLSISLVDHNRIRSSLRHLDGNVVEILDHHEDEGYHTDAVPEGSDARNIAFRGRDALVGSTCTLVAERMLQAADAITVVDGGKQGSARLDPSASLVLLGVILLDTMDMSPEAGKGTARDSAVINALLDRTDWNKLKTDSMEESARAVFEANCGGSDNIKPNRAALHDLLRNSKFDENFWLNMSVYDCLRIDYKRFEPSKTSDDSSGDAPIAFGMSSVLLPLSNFLSKNGCADSITQYMENVDIPLCGVLTMTIVDDTPHREMLLAGWPNLVDAAAKYLTTSDDAAFLEVKEVECSLVDGDCMKYRRFRQGNPKGSRKQVAPILMRFVGAL